MKHFLPLLLACLLLCGCTQDTPPTETSSAPTPVPTVSAAPVGLYQAGSDLEQHYGGALRVYPTNLPTAYAMRSKDNGLLVFSGENTTTLTLLTGDALYITAQTELSFRLDPNDPSLRIGIGELSYYDSQTNSTVVLNSKLKAVSHIAAPADLCGSPVLSADRNTLYYCTADSVRAWDMETGIRRCVKEMSFDTQTVTALHMEDTILQCRITDDGEERTLLLDADSGLLLYEGEGDLDLTTNGELYYASIPNGMIDSPVFGQGEDQPRTLIPKDLTADAFFLDDSCAAITYQALPGETAELVCYDLSTGLMRSALTLNTRFYPTAVADTMNGQVYVMFFDPAYGCETIYRWDLDALSVNDGTVHTETYFRSTNPDEAGLFHCRALAAEIGSKYGIEILVWEDALAVQPWDYDFVPEYLVPVIQQELEQLDQRLSNYPEGMLAATAAHFSSLKICLVRQLMGTAESGSLENANGIQFYDGTDAYVAIAVGEFSEQTLYHELFHVMETHIFTHSIAFDQWDALNPAGFEYDYDYITNVDRDSGVYLQEETRAFVDTYSMSYPKEDRARIMEYACLPENEEVFRSETMQRKLTTLCKGIREAYGLVQSPETYLWEQYLEESLTMTSN